MASASLGHHSVTCTNGDPGTEHIISLVSTFTEVTLCLKLIIPIYVHIFSALPGKRTSVSIMESRVCDRNVFLPLWENLRKCRSGRRNSAAEKSHRPPSPQHSRGGRRGGGGAGRLQLAGESRNTELPEGGHEGQRVGRCLKN